MARAGASKSLDQRTPKARGTSEAVKPAPAKAVAKKPGKKSEPAAVGAKPAAVTPKPAAKPAKSAATTSKPVRAAKPAAVAKPARAARPATAAKAAKAAKPAAGAVKPVKRAPARAVNVKAKAAPTRSVPTKRNSEVPLVAEAPKGKRAGTATKAPAKAAPATAEKPEAGGGFPAKTLDKLRRLLEEERETYVRQAHDLAAEAEALASEREPGDTQFDEESGEGDTLNVERERDLALSASATQAVEEIDRALGRMDAGTYGVCERCGRKITVARLEALPFAALCIECKSREERRR